MSFENLGLTSELQQAVADKGYTEPTPVQEKAIPVILEGRDVMAGAQTGTGKTAGFTLPMLQRLNEYELELEEGEVSPVRALVLTPTRELAAQVGEAVATYGKHLPLRSAVIFGGVKINPQIAQLKKGVDILIATPGRLLDHAGQGTVDLSEVEILVLDEADRMLDMGFIHDIRKVLDLLPENHERQNLLFSATFADEIKTLANTLLNNPELIEVTPPNTTVERIAQRVYPVDRHRKRELLIHLVQEGDWQQVLVFTRTKHGANRLAKQLEAAGLTAAAIHGNKSQGARTKALAGFKDGTVRILVATDIAARGLDIDQLPHVVNFDLPHVAEDYVHRIGRTGRAGNEGEAVSLVCIDEHKLLADIEKFIGMEIPEEILEGYEPDPSIEAQPIQKGRQGRGQGQGRGRGQNQGRGRGRDGQRQDRGRGRGQQQGKRRTEDGQGQGQSQGQSQGQGEGQQEGQGRGKRRGNNPRNDRRKQGQNQRRDRNQNRNQDGGQPRAQSGNQGNQVEVDGNSANYDINNANAQFPSDIATKQYYGDDYAGNQANGNGGGNKGANRGGGGRGKRRASGNGNGNAGGNGNTGGNGQQARGRKQGQGKPQSQGKGRPANKRRRSGGGGRGKGNQEKEYRGDALSGNAPAYGNTIQKDGRTTAWVDES